MGMRRKNKIASICLWCLLLLISLSKANAAIYKYVDKDGLITYSNKPKEFGESVLVIEDNILENWRGREKHSIIRSIKLKDLPNIAKTMSPKNIYNIVAKSVYMLYALGEESRAQGSGVAISEKYILTNLHVIKDRDVVIGKNINGVIKLHVVAESKKYDLALLESNLKLTPLEWRKAYSRLSVGDKVYLVSSPNGLENTFSDGIISSLRRADGVRFIQTTTPLTHGSSGGALFGESGELIGIATLGSNSGNTNFAVSVDEIFTK